MTLNVERRNRNEALVSERGETWQKPTAKLATIIHTGSPKQNAVTSTHALEFVHGVYSLEPMNSYHLFAANSFLKIHKWQWPSLRKTTNLLLRKPNVLIIVTGVPEWSLTSDLISNSYGQNKNEEVKNGNLLHQQLFSRVVNFQWISLWVPVLSLSVSE